MTNANPLLGKLTKLRDVIKDEEHDRKQAIDILDANITSLRKEYTSMLIEYLKVSKVLKNVTWRLQYDHLHDMVFLYEDGWKVDIKEELKDCITDEYTPTISLLQDDYVDDSLIRLWLPEYNEPPYIEIKRIEHLGSLLTDYELDVDLTHLQKLIDAKQAEVAVLEQIKQSVPN